MRAIRVGFEAVIPDPKLKLPDQIREAMQWRHYSIWTEQSYCDWIRRYVQFHHFHSRQKLAPGQARIEELLGHEDVSTMMIYTHVLRQSGPGMKSPLDCL